ncbi:aromatic ring-hydroxylating oxygenase subunit alpha [Sandarakinorhabdus rubra]|uniref:aromatic ring-hydroxylating oxygenase subunit alpha n=1 Tax=Sandarakinorhabdus rubra TaxID=2672568 RepID=UPI0013DD7E1E|nr:aromatic ring-hydroxylating dioxygenase subunit alpha [Sandarakinorhabdus rubra]
MATQPEPAADPDAGWSLPAWIYHDAEWAQAEAARLFRPSWQIVCHLNDIPNTGDWQSLDYLGESIIVVRGEDGAPRAFTNVCRHRGSRLLDGTHGCARKLVCPYHAWVYELDGQLSGVPLKSTYPAFDLAGHGLAPVDLEVWRGFIFVRLAPGLPSVAEMMAPWDDQVALYRFEDMQPLAPPRTRPRAVNWKNLTDNYSDNLHILPSHPGLKRMFGPNYVTLAGPWSDWLGGPLCDLARTGSWSERLYARLLPRVAHLPDDRQLYWWYIKLWPNIAFDIYADQIDFMQFLPTGPTTTALREISYALPDDRREMRAARYLSGRINREVNAEDTTLVSRVQAGMASSSFTVGPLSQTEVCLRSFAARVRSLIPEARLHHPPAPGWSRKYTHPSHPDGRA